MENTRPHYPVPEVPEGKIIFHDDVLHWLVKHVGNHIKDLTPDVGSEELCAPTAHANVMVCALAKGKENKSVKKENLENSLWKKLVDFNALFKKKNISLHRKSFKKVYNNFQITSSLLIPNYPVEPCTTTADWMHWASAGRVNSSQLYAKIRHSQRDTLPTFAADSLRYPEMGDGNLEVDRTDKPHPTAEKAQCLAPPGTSGRGENKLLALLLSLPWWVTLADSRPQTQLCYKDLLLYIGSLQSTACPEWLFQWLVRIKCASPRSKCWLPSKPEEPLQENIA